MKKTLLLFASLFMSLAAFAQLAGGPTWTRLLDEQPSKASVELLSASDSKLQVHLQVPGFYATTVATDRGEAQVITLPKAPNCYLSGEPDLPFVVIPAIIDDQAQMEVQVVDVKYQDFEGMEIAPSKGDISRQLDPATVPYTYGASYYQDAFTPAQQADLYEPYILRDFRGQNIVVKPFAYNPVTKVLRVYYDLVVEMKSTGKGGVNTLNRKSGSLKMDSEFNEVYSRQFINYQEVKNRYTPIGENGALLIICPSSYMSAMQPFVTWKITIGRPTEMVSTSVTGTSASSIQSYITSYYNSHPNLTHVLLVGDYNSIPGVSMNSFGDYSGYSDQRYGQIVGNDYYNDIFIGRFSANSAAQVTTQVNRTITYERDLNTSATWLKKGLGVSAQENGSGHNGEDDYEHIDLIRNDLLGYTYSTVFREYYGVSGITSTTTTISNDINGGVGIINYCNHGSETSWQSHNYSNSHVNALTNSDKLPFIISTACLNGKYDYSGGDCFAETWMHATNGSTTTPTGAIGGIFSYISQPWIPPMEGQDEMNDILVESYNNNIKRTLAGVLTNGNMAVLDYSTSSAARGTYCTWNIFGDPTLTLRTNTPAAMSVNHPGVINLGQNTYTVQVPNGNGALATISYENAIMGSATVTNGVANITLDEAPDEIGDLTLCVFGYNKVTYLGTISVVGGAQYGITLGSCEHGTFDVTPNPAYVGQTVTLTAHPDPGYCLLEWHVTTNAKSQNIPVTNNQFVMPEGEVTVTATFVVGHTVTLAEVEHGSIAANPTTALQGTTITLTASPATGYTLGDWLVYKTGDLSSTITVTDNQFVMPDYDVTVTAFFVLPASGNTTIGSGSGTTNGNYLPTSDFYNYSLTQQIYTPAEMGSAGTITDISFYYNSTTASKPRNLTIYMTNTNSSTLSAWVAQSSSNIVYSGSVTFTNGWNAITLTTPFEYNGTSKVLLTVDDNTGSWSTNSYFRTYSTSANRALYYRDDNNNPSATGSNSVSPTQSQYNSQIIITKMTASAASLAVTEESLSGFSYGEGQGPSAAQSFDLMGYVAENIVVTAPADYEVSTTATGTYSNTLTLPAPGGNGGLVTASVYVRLKAYLTMGDYNGEILTVSCGEVSKSVTLNGTVLNSSHWTLVPGLYADNMTLLGVIFLDGEEQRSTELEVGAFCGDEIRGTGKATYCPPVDRYILPLIVYGNVNDAITFKLYDPSVEEEYDSDPGLVLSFTTDGYGSITQPEVLSFFTTMTNPIVVMDIPANQINCHGTMTLPVEFTTTITDGEMTYAWVNDTPEIGLATAGEGNIPAFTAVNTTNATLVATITVSPTYTNNGISYVGEPVSFTITVNPQVVMDTPESQVVCHNTEIESIVFTTTITDGEMTYAWVNDTPEIGLAAAGEGDIPAFTAVNTTNATLVATITVTPIYTNNGISCVGEPISFTITVNPQVVMDTPDNQVNCHGTETLPVEFTTPVADGEMTYAWVNDTPEIGLAAEGEGDIPAFTAVNTTNATSVATITVTPTYTNNGISCVGEPVSFTITVNPQVVMDTPESQVVCHNTEIESIVFTTTITDGEMTYAWVNDTPEIGLAAEGEGNIAAFTAVNTTNATLVATITVTPIYTNNGISCVGEPISFTITVNPQVVMDTPDNQVNCHGTETLPVEFTTPVADGEMTYAWVNDTPEIGLAAEGEGNIPAFTAVNTTNATLVATITVTPTYTNNGISRVGEPVSFTYTVNEYPEANAGADLCIPYNTSTNLNAGNAGAGATYNWSPANLIQGNANQPTVTTVNLTETTTFTVTVTKNGCSSTDEVTVYVGSELSVSATANPETICQGETSILTAMASNGLGEYTYTWSPDDLIMSGQNTNEVETVPLTSNAEFTCTVSDGIETVEATVQVIVKALPITGAGQDQTISYGATANLRAYNAGVGAVYSWEPAELIQGDAQQRFVTTVNLYATQTFTLTVTRNGCEVVDEMTVFVTPPTQTIALENGWKWMSVYMECDETTLNSLKNSISASNVSQALIKSQTGSLIFEDGNWFGNSLTALENENMYMVQLDQNLNVTLNGSVANPEAHPITLNMGWKWISFLSMTPMSLGDALSGITPNADDVIKGQDGFSSYDGASWVGSLTNLEPGKGYMYQNNGDANLTLVYPTAGKGVVEESSDELHWKNDPYQFAHNLSMMVSLEGVTLSEGSHEIGAFVNGECRGSALVQQVNNQFMAFLTVTGESGDMVSFKVYDVNTHEEWEGIEERLSFSSDDILGSLRQPFMLHLNANGLAALHGQVSIFPNPTQAGTELHLVVPSHDQTLTVEVIDLLGATVYTGTTRDGILRGMRKSGIYTLKATDLEGNTYYGKLIIND